MTDTTPQSAGEPIRIGVRVVCVVCDQMKQPVGRSAPMECSYCDWECSGYHHPPYPGSLWPGETSEAFGYPVSDHGTEPIGEPV